MFLFDVSHCNSGLAFKSKNYNITSQNHVYFIRENFQNLFQKPNRALWIKHQGRYAEIKVQSWSSDLLLFFSVKIKIDLSRELNIPAYYFMNDTQWNWRITFPQSWIILFSKIWINHFLCQILQQDKFKTSPVLDNTCH